jgi:hypothetical protein
MYFAFKGRNATWIKEIETKILEGLLATNVPILLRDNEINNFFEFVCACHYYGMSPTVLTSKDQAGNFGPPRIMSLTRFEQILKALSHDVVTGMGAEEWITPSDRLQPFNIALDSMCLQFQHIGFVRGKSIISADDEKLRHRIAMAAQKLNLRRTSQRNSGKAGTYFWAPTLLHHLLTRPVLLLNI